MFKKGAFFTFESKKQCKYLVFQSKNYIFAAEMQIRERWIDYLRHTVAC